MYTTLFAIVVVHDSRPLSNLLPEWGVEAHVRGESDGAKLHFLAVNFRSLFYKLKDFI